MRIFFILLIVCFLLSCRKDESLFKIENLRGDTITVIGHAGMGNSYRYSGNTYESFSRALKFGVHGVEMDVQMTKDCVLVLYHHQHLEDVTSCHGLVNDNTWEDLKGCYYREKTGKPLLLSAAEFFNSDAGAQAKIMVLDLKQTDTSTAYSERFAWVILETLQRFKITEKCITESSQLNLLRALSKEPALKLFVYADRVNDGYDMAGRVKLAGITIDMDKITKEEISQAHSKNLQVSLFNARTEKKNAEAMFMGPDYIQTDRVEYLMKIANK